MQNLRKSFELQKARVASGMRKARMFWRWGSNGNIVAAGAWGRGNTLFICCRTQDKSEKKFRHFTTCGYLVMAKRGSQACTLPSPSLLADGCDMQS